MFEKLLAILPYNPGVVHQMSFYSRRMREEASIRRVGMIFMVLTFFIQFFAVISPPQPTLAASDNDLVSGGISSAADAREKCISDTRGYQRIMHYYGISCSAFDNAETLCIHTGAQDYYSMGHNLSSGEDHPRAIDGAGTVYWRKLSTWTQPSCNNQPGWKVLRVRDQNAKVFYVMYDCGNLVSVGVPPGNQLVNPPENPPVQPPPTDRCGEKPGIQTRDEECDVCDNLPGIQTSVEKCDVCPNVAGVQTNTSQCDVCTNIPGVQTSAAQCDVCPDPGTQTSTTQCDSCPNKPGVQVSGDACDVCADTDGVQTSLSQCDVCPNIGGVQTSPSQCDVCPNIPGVQTSATSCDVCPGKAGVQTSTNDCDVCPSLPGTQTSADQCDVCPDTAGIQTSTSQCKPPCPYNSSLKADDAACKPCDKSTNQGDSLACVSIRKTAANNTAGLTDANGSTAKAGDVITYTLYAENQGKAKIEGFVFQENLSDVSDYADITDLHGGSLDAHNIATWPAKAIPAGGTISVEITVKVKTPIPDTPVSTSDQFHFDLTMTNVYGNTINIKLPPSPTKTMETVATTLPNTGPGTTLLITAVVVMAGGYFYGRARLLAQESQLAVQETSGA